MVIRVGRDRGEWQKKKWHVKSGDVNILIFADK